MTQPPLSLNQLPKQKPAIITGFNAPSSDLETRLREIGFAEGDHVSVEHKGFFGGNPISVNLNGALIALRKQDASAIIVSEVDKSA